MSNPQLGYTAPFAASLIIFPQNKYGNIYRRMWYLSAQVFFLLHVVRPGGLIFVNLGIYLNQ
jgi:hypothetical protein